MPESCPVCKCELKDTHRQNDRYHFECPRCGSYSLTASALPLLQQTLQSDEWAWVRLSHVLNRMTESQPWPSIDSYNLENILSNTSLPSLGQQLDNLISFLAKKQPSPGKAVEISDRVEAAVGLEDAESLAFVIDQAKESGLVDGASRRATSSGVVGKIQLTVKGSKYYEELQRGNNSSRTAFMAMEFGDKDLDAIYRDHFKDAVAATGFKLKRNDEAQKAGLIDDHMRIEIRQSRFLIADLTNHNQGAYWESGYAEGLGKPVIYTCRKDSFEKKGTHFDTNHHLTVKWDPSNMEEAVEKLKATIRATLPGEARLSDESLL